MMIALDEGAIILSTIDYADYRLSKILSTIDYVDYWYAWELNIIPRCTTASPLRRSTA